MAKGSRKEPTSEPTVFPQTTPSVGGDMGAWVLNAINRMEGTLGKIEATQGAMAAQLGRVESSVNTLKETVSGHEKWVHTLKVLLGLLGLLVTWLIVYIALPWLKAKLTQP